MRRWPKTRGRLGYWFRQTLLAAALRRLQPLWIPAAFLWRRLLFRTTFIAVTGSLGKTTAKECLAHVLGTAAPCFRSYRNQNSHAMVPLNLLRVRPWHRFAVLEVAAAAPNRMRRPARLVQPDMAIVLGIQRTHSGEYRDLDQHAAEKSILLDHLGRGGLALLNGDDPRVARMADATAGEVRLFGTADEFYYGAQEVRATWPERLRFIFSAGSTTLPIETQLVGEHWLPVALATLAAAHWLGVDPAVAAKALAKAAPFPGRLSPFRIPGGAIVLRDDCNGSVTGTDAALHVLETDLPP